MQRREVCELARQKHNREITLEQFLAKVSAISGKTASVHPKHFYLVVK
jgi:hypothetical protein